MHRCQGAQCILWHDQLYSLYSRGHHSKCRYLFRFMAVESYSVYTSVSFSFVRFSVLLLIAKLSHPHLWTQYHFTVRLQFIISSTLDEHSVVSSLGLSPLNIFVCVQFCWVDTHLASHAVSGSTSLIEQVG